MPLFQFEGSRPHVDPRAWVAPTATLVGDVTVENGASVWYGAVLRGDFGPIVVRAGANIQDNSVVHTDGTVTEIGPGATIGHLCVVHACTIGAEALVGNAATVQDRAVVGARAMVGAGALVVGGSEVPPETLAVGVPARVRGPLTESARQWVDGNPAIYQDLARRHGAGVREIPPEDI